MTDAITENKIRDQKLQDLLAQYGGQSNQAAGEEVVYGSK